MIVEGMDRMAFGRAMFSFDVLDLPAKGEDAHLVAPGFIGISDGATPLGTTALSHANIATMLLSLIAERGHRSAASADTPPVATRPSRMVIRPGRTRPVVYLYDAGAPDA